VKKSVPANKRGDTPKKGGKGDLKNRRYEVLLAVSRREQPGGRGVPEKSREKRIEKRKL